MTKELSERKPVNLLKTLNNYIEQTGLENAKTFINSKTGTASITGTREGLVFTTTVKKEKSGIVRTDSAFKTNIGKAALVEQIKELLRQGYKQREVADMLNISQSLVSKYSKL